MRPRDRGDRRAPRLEAGPLRRRSRRTCRAARDRSRRTRRDCRSPRLSGAMPEALRTRFCGVHFFNPPRYMHLVELIAAPQTDPALLDALEALLTTTLGKGVIRAKDTPNFIANRIGIFSVLATMQHTQTYRLSFDVVDALTGPAIGRAKSATYRTADVVGLDTMAHVVKTMYDTLPDDPWHALFATPPVLAALVAQGALGAKTKAGFFRKVGKDIQVLDPAARDYRKSDARGGAGSRGDPQDQVARREVREAARVARIRRRSSCGRSSATSSTTARIHLADDRRQRARRRPRDPLGLRLADGTVRDVAGGGMERGRRPGSPRTSRPARRSPSVPLPAWVSGEKVRAARGVHAPQGAYSAARDDVRAAARRCRCTGGSSFPIRCWARRPPTAARRSSRPTPCACGTWATTSASCRSRARRTRSARTCSTACCARVDEAERNCAGLVIWQTQEPFSLGANLAAIAPAIAGEAMGRDRGGGRQVPAARRCACGRASCRPSARCAAWRSAARASSSCTRTARSPRSSPTSAWSRSAWACCRPAAAARSSRCARRRKCAAAPTAARSTSCRSSARYFQTIAMATVSKSALEAKELGYLRPADIVVMNALRAAARREVAGAGAGRRGLPAAAARAQRAGGRQDRLRDAADDARQHARRRASSARTISRSASASRACCAAARSKPGSLVDETWLLDARARASSWRSLRDEQTQARIAHTLPDRQAAAQLSSEETIKP